MDTMFFISINAGLLILLAVDFFSKTTDQQAARKSSDLFSHDGNHCSGFQDQQHL